MITRTLAMPPAVVLGTNTSHTQVGSRSRAILAPWDVGMEFGRAVKMDDVNMQIPPPPRAAVAGFSSTFVISLY